MKKLSEVTQEDAIKILQGEYAFFRTGRWVLTDETEAIKEPCKKLSCPRKAYVFWFFDNKMDIDLIDDEAPITLDDTNYDVKHSCYVKAYELGYSIPAFAALATLPEPGINLTEWIRVEDRFPERGQNVAFIIKAPGSDYDGRVLGGRYNGFDFSTPGFGCDAYYWQPLPAPPLSHLEAKEGRE